MAASTRACSLCSENFIVNTKFLICDFCELLFHTECAKVNDTFLKAKQDCVNVKWFCDDCIPKLKQTLNVNIKQCYDKTEEVNGETSKLK